MEVPKFGVKCTRILGTRACELNEQSELFFCWNLFFKNTIFTN